MDSELIAYLQAMEQRLTAKIDASVQALEQRLTAKIEASENRTVALVVEVKESLEREIQDVSGKVDRMSVRLDKIAAGAHYVSRLVEWSEKRTSSRRILPSGFRVWKRA